eukprot:m.199308 g.199308  ORF g.199308 m.199308 type:complete len:268 (+) comp39567_c0_seq43:1852-2655(+)
MATSLAHEGSGFCFLAPSVYQYIINPDVTFIEFDDDEVADGQIADWITQVQSISADSDLQDFVTADDNESLSKAISDSGYNGILTVAKKPLIVKSLRLQYSILNVKAELDQLRSGLESAFDVLSLIAHFPYLLRDFFVYDENAKLTGEKISKLFTNVVYSSKDENLRQWEVETTTYMLFEVFLENCETGKTQCKLENVLAFFTGSSQVPPGGFKRGAKLTFDPNTPLPMAAICFLELRLPTRYASDEEGFQEALTHAFLSIGHLGRV